VFSWALRGTKVTEHPLPARLAENCGLTVEQEATDGGRDRRSDLVISGGGVRVAWEVPLSPSTPVIYTSGSTWHSVTAGAAIDVSPTSLGATGQTRTRATAIKDVFASETLQSDDPRILSGIKHIKLECCLATAEPGWHLRK